MAQFASKDMRSKPLSLVHEIALLRDLDLKELQVRWKGVFRKQAPPHLPQHLLLGILTYRLHAPIAVRITRADGAQR
jgi:hypothetical protein